MRKLWYFLSVCVLMLGGSAAGFAQGPKGSTRIITTVSQKPISVAAVNKLKMRLKELYGRGTLSAKNNVAYQILSASSSAQAGENAWAGQVYGNLGVTPSLTPQQIKNVASEEVSMSWLTDEQREFFYQTALAKELIEGTLVPKQPVLDRAAIYYRHVLRHSDNAAEVMSAVTNLGLLSNKVEDAKTILQVAKKFGAQFDPITARALLYLGAPELQQLANYRAEMGELGPVWGQLKLYTNQAGITLELPAKPSGKNATATWNVKLQKQLGLAQPYNLFYRENDPMVTQILGELRRDVQARITQAFVATQVQAGINLPAVSKPAVQNPDAEPAKTFEEEMTVLDNRTSKNMNKVPPARELYAQLRQFQVTYGRNPRNVIKEKKIKECTPEEKTELLLGQRVRRFMPLSNYFTAAYNEFCLRGSDSHNRKAEAFIEEYEAFLAQYGRNPSLKSTDEQEHDLAVRMWRWKYQGNPKNPSIQKILALFEQHRQNTAAQPLKQVYDEFVKYLRENEEYPSGYSGLYMRIRGRLYGKTFWIIRADKQLYKLYQLDELAHKADQGLIFWKDVFDFIDAN